METATHPAFGMVGKVLCIVNPPGSVVIPQMMERVSGGGSDGENGPVDGDGAHGLFGLEHRKPGQ